MAVVTIAPIASRTGSGGVNSDGVYQTGSRAVPAGTYSSILFTLTFNTEATDFVVGDTIFGSVELSTDGGATWSTLCTAEWRGGANTGRGYNVAINNLTVPANSVYRASAKVLPVEGPTGSVTFGVTANATLAA